MFNILTAWSFDNSCRMGSAPAMRNFEFVSPVLPFGLCDSKGFQKATVLPVNFPTCLGL